jgi:hypothetical protein
MRALLILIAAVALNGLVLADPPQPVTPASPSTPPSDQLGDTTLSRSGAEEISTELRGLDTLELVPTEVETQVAGGTRRVHLESTVFRREEPVVYEPGGRRDPFRALLVDEKREGEVKTELLRLEGATLRGVVWAEGVYVALVTDKDGKSFMLRPGDPVYQGRVLTVTQSEATFGISDFGDYQTITLKVRG